MKRAQCALYLVVATGALLLGCGKKTETETASQTTATTSHDAAQTTRTANVPAESGRIPAPQGAVTMAQAVNVAGNLGCGHCTFHVKNECSLAMKAQDGTVYLLNAGERQEELMGKRYDEVPVHVAGQLTEVEGLKVITTETVELN